MTAHPVSAILETGYRPEIDGLRAVAVLMVLLFHGELGFSGGYVGVDIFFVISGYLITRLVLKDLANQRFTLTDFWVRRIRRIVPASLVMTLATLVCGAFWLSPRDLEELGESAVAQQLMLSNLYFWQDTGYFEGPADLKPLLHTWSLAVEEQFYLFYPFVLLAIAARSRRWQAGCLALIAAGSLAVSVAGMFWAPSATFFLLPGRIWELLLGGLLCYLPTSAIPSSAQVRWAERLGVVCIGVSAGFYTADVPFPGLAALPPCLGAALVIAATGHPGSQVRQWLTWQPMVAIGLISYSLYLWHWPILVFCRYLFGADFTIGLRCLALAASVIVACLSWRFIETPFRKRAPSTLSQQVFIGYFATACVMIATGIILDVQDGFPHRFSAEQLRRIATFEQPKGHRVVSLHEVQSQQLPEFGDPNSDFTCLIWGDSHAMAVVPALETAFQELGIRGFQATYSGTLPLLDFHVDREWAAASTYNRAVLDVIHKQDFDLIILGGYWSRDSADPRFRSAMRTTIEQLTATGARVVVLRDVPIQGQGMSSTVSAPLRRGSDAAVSGITLAEHRLRQEAADAAIDELEGLGIIVADPALYLLDSADRCPIVMDGDCLYADEHHLSITGAQRLVPMFLEICRPFSLQTTSQPVAAQHPGQHCDTAEAPLAPR